MSSSSTEYNSSTYLKNLLQVDAEQGFAQALQTNFSKTHFNVLSMGCGDAQQELNALIRFFNAKHLTFTYMGIDIDKHAIAANKKNFENVAKGKNIIQFHEISIVDKDAIAKLFPNEAVHIMIFRHPVLWEANEDSKYFNYALTDTLPNTLAPGGALLVSIYHPEEKNTFEQLMSTVTNRPVISLAENTSNLFTTEVQSTYCTDIYRDVFADRFFFAITNFQLSLAQKMEKTKSDAMVSPDESDALYRHYKKLYAKVGCGKLTTYLQFMIHSWLNNITQNFEHFKKSSLADIKQELINPVKAMDETSNVQDEKYQYSMLAFSIAKTFLHETRSDISTFYLKKLIEVMIRSIENSTNANEFLLSAQQYLKLIERRPLAADIFPSASDGVKKEVKPSDLNQPGLW